ncbi:MAG: TlpA disulfide reductase family protein [Sphingomonas sp.]|jgi:thiol-disulfide isomerase/thioredoxin|uniref:TlpA family protein disulfide reductase n=1 Tax=Sphingomonas sp. TaxID=28214 RepID=UPI003564FB7A
MGSGETMREEAGWSLGRRALLGGLAAGFILPGPLDAEPEATVAPRLFAGTALRDNRLALGFEKVNLPLPAVRVSNGAGTIDFDSLSGKTRIVTLWAEWCVPCLVEARDFAALRRRYAGPDFDIVAVLTGSAEKLDYAGAAARLHQSRVDGLPLLVERDGGRRLLLSLSPGPSGQGSLPCTLLVDASGRVRGRSHGAPFGGPVARDAAGKPVLRVLNQADKQALLASDRTTLWATPAGDALVTALRSGLPR